MFSDSNRSTSQPRWPAIIALLALGFLQWALPRELSAGPDWLTLVLIGALLVPGILTRRAGRFRANEVLGIASSALVTGMLVWSLTRLIASLLAHRISPGSLLAASATLWFSNILVFASWYWRLDAGGPNARDLRDAHTEGAFLFPQMTIPELQTPEGARGWSPEFMDYLFLAFNTSTAFSPTDVPVLSRWAKALMMLQAMVSLATVTLLAARAVNIL